MLLEKVSASTAAKSSEFGELRVLGSQSKRLERQRGRWSFLTWSFFLAQVMAGEQFFGSGARAAQADDSVARSKGHSDSTHNDVSDNPGPGVAAAGDRANETAASQTEAHAAQVGGLFNNLQSSEPGAHATLSNNAGHGDFGDASPSGSGSSGPHNSNGTSQAGSEVNHDLSHVIGGDSGLGFDNLAATDTVLDLGLSQLPVQIHGSGDTISQILATTLDQTGIHLGETVGGLTALLGEAVDNTLNQITGLHLVGNGELTALLGGSVDNSLSVAFDATKALITQTAEMVSSVGTLASSVTNLGLLGNIGDVASNGTVSEVVHSAFNQVAGMQLVDDAGGLGKTLNALLGGSTDTLTSHGGETLTSSLGVPAANASMHVLTDQGGEGVTSSMGTPALNIVSDVTQLASLGPNQDVSSGGTIAFPVVTSANIHQIDDLFAGGRYTDYSLALHSDVNSGVTAIATTPSSEINSTSGALPLIDSPTHSHDSGSAPLQNVHDVSTSLVNHLI